MLFIALCICCTFCVIIYYLVVLLLLYVLYLFLYLILFFVFFFFNQKPAYEMRISDWSSDVCSSDLVHFSPGCPNFRQFRRLGMEPAGYLVRLCAGAATAIGRGRRNRRIFLGLRAPDPRPAAAVNGQRTLHPTPHANSPDRQNSLHRRYFLTPFNIRAARSEEHTSELQSLMRISYAVFCLKKKTRISITIRHT